jgi:F-type H+/Na+-transporting ATPase subunit alpha
MPNLLMEIEAQILGAKTSAAKQNVGIIREIGDGVARIEGLSDAMLNEMIDLGHGATGLALNVDETEVGVVGSGTTRSAKRAMKFEPRASFCRFRLEGVCSVA